MYRQQLKALFPTYSETKLNKIITYLNNYNIDDEQKINHIKNLYKLAYVTYKLYINS